MPDHLPEPPEYGEPEVFFRPSPKVNHLVEQLQDELRGSLQAQVQEELDRLRDENETLRRRCANLSFLEEAANSARKTYEQAASNATFAAQLDVKTSKARDLLTILATPKYKVAVSFEMGPKCEQCDENRFLKYLSPRGTEMSEHCACADTNVVYRVQELMVCSVDHSRYEMSIWYKPAEQPDNHGLETMHVASPDGVPLAVVVGDYQKYGFDTREAAQEIADALNEKRDFKIDF